MASETFFNSPFDDGTNCKLELYKLYLKEWLPVFFSSPKPIWKNIGIYDFFAGQGKDSNGAWGSPLITVSEINKNLDYIKNNDLNVKLCFNELDAGLFDLLQKNVLPETRAGFYNTEFYNQDFKKCFYSQLESMRSSANFIFLDQKGIKQITEDIFAELINLKQTDFIFFISSSFIRRFGESEEFRQYLHIRKEDVSNKDYFHIHRLVLEYYRSLIPTNKRYFLAPFSIKKDSNIYGLIFGSNHIYGLEKFLKSCWKIDSQRGEANFDIDREKISTEAPSLFPEFNKPSKRKLFEDDFTSKVLSGELDTNYKAYLFTLENGFLPKDANTELRKLEKNKKIILNCKLGSQKVHNISVGSIQLI
ncbi:MAG: three-Cys-motif partner protein TcmP [Bacteroidota bacterium]